MQPNEPGSLICWQCGGDVPYAAWPSPFCTYACRDTYWGVENTPRCRCCGTPAGSCATTRSIVGQALIGHSTACCAWCNHYVPLTDDAAVPT